VTPGSDRGGLGVLYVGQHRTIYAWLGRKKLEGLVE